MMKAIRLSEYGGPAVLKLEDVPTPKPGPGQVLVRNHAVGVNPVDTYLRSNTDNRGPKLPYTPGSDSAGVVEAVGAVFRDIRPAASMLLVKMIEAAMKIEIEVTARIGAAKS